MERINGLTQQEKNGLQSIEQSEDGLYSVQDDGVVSLYTTIDRKVTFVETQKQTYCHVSSALGYPAIYPVKQAAYTGKPAAVLMDLDGTSVHSEAFWVYIIEQTMVRLMQDDGFRISQQDIPFVSGHSVSEHLQYCICKYCPDQTVERARELYYEVTRAEMAAIMQGKGKQDAFRPAPYLKEFLLALKEKGIKIGLVTSGLYEKAMPEIVSAFRTLELGDPLDFYDAIITAGQAMIPGQAGTLGELAPKPHPWLYAECARVGLGIDETEKHRVIGLEDSSAGVLSLRLAGFSCIGVDGGNIQQSGAQSLCSYMAPDLKSALEYILTPSE